MMIPQDVVSTTDPQAADAVRTDDTAMPFESRPAGSGTASNGGSSDATSPRETSQWIASVLERLGDSAAGFTHPEVISQFISAHHERDMDRLKLAHERELKKAEHDLLTAKVRAKEDRWNLELAAEREKLLADLQVETGLDKLRGFVLVAVVFAVVATPIFAMFTRVQPESFVQYITPITGITGTILGYWFGQEGKVKRSPRTKFRVTADEKIVQEAA